MPINSVEEVSDKLLHIRSVAGAMSVRLLHIKEDCSCVCTSGFNSSSSSHPANEIFGSLLANTHTHTTSTVGNRAFPVAAAASVCSTTFLLTPRFSAVLHVRVGYFCRRKAAVVLRKVNVLIAVNIRLLDGLRGIFAVSCGCRTAAWTVYAYRWKRGITTSAPCDFYNLPVPMLCRPSYSFLQPFEDSPIQPFLSSTSFGTSAATYVNFNRFCCYLHHLIVYFTWKFQMFSSSLSLVSSTTLFILGAVYMDYENGEN